MISTDVIVGVKALVLVGAVMWFCWRQAKLMERARAEDARRAADEAKGER